MTDTQLYLAIGIPTLPVLIGLLLNIAAVRELRDQMNLRFADVAGRLDRVDSRLDRVDGRLGVVESDLRSFYSITGKLDGRLDQISRRP